MAGMSVVVRADGNPLALAPAIRAAIASLDRTLAMPSFRTLDQVVSDSLDRPRFYMTLLGMFSMIALVLAAIGIFGLVSFAVSQRTQEFGVRIALGASPRELLVSIVRGALVLVALGLVIGFSGAVVLTRVLSGLLYGVTPGDPATLAVVAGTLAATAVAASIVPAWRASTVNPIVALRAD